jgi:pantothenate kinase
MIWKLKKIALTLVAWSSRQKNRMSFLEKVTSKIQNYSSLLKFLSEKHPGVLTEYKKIVQAGGEANLNQNRADALETTPVVDHHNG